MTEPEQYWDWADIEAVRLLALYWKIVERARWDPVERAIRACSLCHEDEALRVEYAKTLRQVSAPEGWDLAESEEI